MSVKSLLFFAAAALSLAVADAAAQGPKAPAQCQADFDVCVNACHATDSQPCYQACQTGFAACLERWEATRRPRLTPPPSLLDPGPGGTQQAPSAVGTPKPTAPPPAGPPLR